MKYWASNIAIVPVERDSCIAPDRIVQESEWASSGITSWMRCGEHPIRLFLHLLLGSIFLIAFAHLASAAGDTGLSSIRCFGVTVENAAYKKAEEEAGIAVLGHYGNAGESKAPLAGGNPSAIKKPQNPNSIVPGPFLALITSNGAILAHHASGLFRPVWGPGNETEKTRPAKGFKKIPPYPPQPKITGKDTWMLPDIPFRALAARKKINKHGTPTPMQ